MTDPYAGIDNDAGFDGGGYDGGPSDGAASPRPRWVEDERYDAVVVESDFGETQQGAPQLAIRFKVEGIGSISAYLSFSEKAWPYTEEKLQALDWDPRKNDYRMDLLGKDVLIDDGAGGQKQVLAGRPCSIVMKYEEYNGKTQAKVAFINPPGGMLVKERMSPEAIQQFSKMLKAGVASGRFKSNSATPTKNAPPARQAGAPARAPVQQRQPPLQGSCEKHGRFLGPHCPGCATTGPTPSQEGGFRDPVHGQGQWRMQDGPARRSPDHGRGPGGGG